MAGLDTRGAFDGFVQGFGMMQSYQDSYWGAVLCVRGVVFCLPVSANSAMVNLLLQIQ